MILTGNGLKDPERAIAVMPRPLSVKASIGAISEHLSL